MRWRFPHHMSSGCSRKTRSVTIEDDLAGATQRLVSGQANRCRDVVVSSIRKGNGSVQCQATVHHEQTVRSNLNVALERGCRKREALARNIQIASDSDGRQ